MPPAKGVQWQISGSWWQTGNAFVGFDAISRLRRGKVADHLQVRIDRMSGGDCAAELGGHFKGARPGTVKVAGQDYAAAVGRPHGPKAELHVCRSDGPWLLKAVVLFEARGKLKLRTARRRLKPYGSLIDQLFQRLKSRQVVLTWPGAPTKFGTARYGAARAPWIARPKNYPRSLRVAPMAQRGVVDLPADRTGVWTAARNSERVRRRLPTLAALDLKVQVDTRHTDCAQAIPAWGSANAGFERVQGFKGLPGGWQAAFWKGMLDPGLILCGQGVGGVFRVEVLSEQRLKSGGGLATVLGRLARMNLGPWYVHGRNPTETMTGSKELRVPSGKVTLPTTGIVVDLPASTFVRFWGVMGSVNLTEDGQRFVSDTLMRYNRRRVRDQKMTVSASFFSKTCAEYLARYADPERYIESVTGQVDLGATVGTTALAGGLSKERAGRGNRQVTARVCFEHPKRKGIKLLWTIEWIRRQPLTATAAASEFRKNLTLAKTLVGAFRADRFELGPGTRAKHVRRSKRLAKPRTLFLPRQRLRVTVPDDGREWTAWKPDAKKRKDKGPDLLYAAAPSVGQMSLAVEVLRLKRFSSCRALIDAAIKAKAAKRFTPPGLPSGWAGYLFKGIDGAWLPGGCKRLSSGRFLQVWSDNPELPVKDFRPLRPIYKALAKFRTGKPPVAPPRTSRKAPPGGTVGPAPKRSRPGRRFSRPSGNRGGSKGMVAIGSQLGMSYRDSEGLGVDVDKYPSLRASFLGVDLNFTFGDFGPGLAWWMRSAAYVALDWGNAFGGPVSNSTCWGGAMYGLDGEAYVGGSDGAFFAGIGAGYQGLKGPITDNSSLSISAMLGYFPDDSDDPGFYLRVTPLQLIPANERWVMSPLTVELRMVLGNVLMVGLEAQYIEAPGDGISDTPAEAFAGVLKLGFGQMGD